MPIQTATLSDLFINKWDVLMYGPPGAGKSHFIQFLPEPFILDFDRGLKTLATLPGEKPKINFLPRPDDPDLTFEQVMLILTQIAARPSDFGKTLVMDTLTEFQRQLLLQEARRQHRVNEIPDQLDYIPVQFKILQLLTVAKKLPLNLYVTAGEQKVFGRDGTSMIRVEPDFSRGLVSKVPRFFDETYYADNPTTGTWTILTQSNGVAYARTRLHIPNDLSHKRVAEELQKRITRPQEPKPLSAPVAEVLEQLTQTPTEESAPGAPDSLEDQPLATTQHARKTRTYSMPARK